jgi:hypothetical protein
VIVEVTATVLWASPGDAAEKKARKTATKNRRTNPRSFVESSYCP